MWMIDMDFRGISLMCCWCAIHFAIVLKQFLVLNVFDVNGCAVLFVRSIQIQIDVNDVEQSIGNDQYFVNALQIDVRIKLWITIDATIFRVYRQIAFDA